MFREMRRKEKMLSENEIGEILESAEYGTLSTINENGYPYGVPLNYYYDGKAIYMHSAKSGSKLDNIDKCNKVSFSVVGKAELVPEKFSTEYKSVILFGKATKVSGDEKVGALLALIKKYSPEFYEAGEKYVDRAHEKTEVIKIEIDHVTGKENKEN